MILKVVFRRAARAEFDGAALWYEERQVGLGLRFASEIDRAVGFAAEKPERFPFKHRDIRCVQAYRFPSSTTNDASVLHAASRDFTDSIARRSACILVGVTSART